MEILRQIDSGELSSEEALARHGISAEELGLWRASVERFGKAGLRVTRVQVYRRVLRRLAYR
jgi:hypothetical protein